MLGLAALAILVGFILLVWGADRFVLGASATARNLGVSPLIIGLTIVGFGTSAPEMLVSAMAAANGNPAMGVGNALGSNITNVGLVLGITALIVPLAVHSSLLKREFPLLLGVMALTLVLLWDREMGFNDGLLLLIGMGLMVAWMVHLGLRQRRSETVGAPGLEQDPMEEEFAEEIPEHMPMGRALFWLLLGMAILVGSSRLLVWGAVEVATWAGISDLVIGLTIVAIGTSLPELAASVMSALKDEADIAIGNVLGSNMFNLLAVLGLPGVIAPAVMPDELIGRDMLVMFALTIALFIFAYGFRGPGRLNRIEGSALLAGYCGYMYWLYLSSLAVAA